VPSNRRSKLITQGVARSPNRAMLRAVGFGDGDFEKPIVGVANGHSTMNPCNAGIQPLVDRAMVARRDAAGIRLPDDHRRHRHEHGSDEVFARVA
jgi:dihydroxy-acid dehydratase